MTKWSHGLIVGKFYPPHLGHLEAIRLAASGCERLTVLVMGSAIETIAYQDRVDWLIQDCAPWPQIAVVGIRCDAPVDVNDDGVWKAQLALMRSALRRSGGDEKVDAVFTAETYGEELAQRLDAHLIALGRSDEGPSGRKARSDVFAAWEDLAPAARAALTLRAVFVGAESTGTTTISSAVAAHYRALGGAFGKTVWVGEFGREYTETKWADELAKAAEAGRKAPALDEIIWRADDFDAVALEQNRRTIQALQQGSPLLVCDTDAFATSIWERRYLGDSARRNQPWARMPMLPRADIHFVTDHEDVPWHDDGLREGDLDVRAKMTGWFIDALTEADHSWVLLSGPLERRVQLAIRTIDALVTNRRTLARPLQGPGFESPT